MSAKPDRSPFVGGHRTPPSPRIDRQRPKPTATTYAEQATHLETDVDTDEDVLDRELAGIQIAPSPREKKQIEVVAEKVPLGPPAHIELIKGIPLYLVYREHVKATPEQIYMALETEKHEYVCTLITTLDFSAAYADPTQLPVVNTEIFLSPDCIALCPTEKRDEFLQFVMGRVIDYMQRRHPHRNTFEHQQVLDPKKMSGDYAFAFQDIATWEPILNERGYESAPLKTPDGHPAIVCKKTYTIKNNNEYVA